MRNITSRELIKLVEAHGWKLVEVRGSHHQFKHPTIPGKVTIPHPRREFSQKLIKSILKQAGLL
ncbi:type II toxin-antitoxin system HicA family toxin [Paenibacillus sp. 598K]|uniref:type II toxin-antitoxin system HicA family toxin n=1 Tax=Paenibacillus sp. 598K TaxID=1117987 RepID=UPI000FFE9CA3|nr:type II toxin-antitoxin system HicA family toxin [Paenibacillus sp. 598K]